MKTIIKIFLILFPLSTNAQYLKEEKPGLFVNFGFNIASEERIGGQIGLNLIKNTMYFNLHF